MAETLALIATGVSAGSSILGGIQANNAAKASAKQSQLAARQEELKGREQALKVKQSLAATLATQNAMFGARGLSPSSSSGRMFQGEASNAASRDIDTAMFGAGQASDALKFQAKQQKLSGKTSLISGFGDATSSLSKIII